MFLLNYTGLLYEEMEERSQSLLNQGYILT